MKNNGKKTTKLLIGLLAVIHLIVHNTDSPEVIEIVNNSVFFGEGVKQGEYWRLVSGAFLHAGMVHLLCNCYCLWQFLPWICNSFGMPKAQLTLWLSVIGGAILSGVMDSTQPGVGISGGIFGLFGVYIVALQILKKHKDSEQVRAALKSAYIMLGLNLMLGFSIPNISNAGHIGGLIVGLILGVIFTRPKIQRVSDS